MRTLVELYETAEKSKIKTPGKITGGEFADFNYQIDAIKAGVDCLEKYDGVMIADVVGLGKSIVAATVADNVSLPRVIVIAPPHLKMQWEKYIQKFKLKNASVVSSGKIKELYTDKQRKQPTLYIIDEAHRYRNENTDAYRLLHQIVYTNPDNKVILLTATPYNNHPRDVYALMKLFQIPGRATLNVIDNLGLRFGQLIAGYNQLEKAAKQELTEDVKNKLKNLAEKMRMIIEPIIIRRSRVDLLEVKSYAEDLARQNISFAKINGPEIIAYDLGELTELYCKTLEGLNAGDFIGAKYKPLTYLVDEMGFDQKFKKVFSFNRTQQLNMAKLAQRLFALRYESSQYAFRKTLENMIAAHRDAVELWQNQKLVAVSKSKTLDKFDDIEDECFTIPRGMLSEDFIEDLGADLAWLERVYQAWFGEEIKYNPKQKQVETVVRKIRETEPKCKIVIFTSFADTANYIVKALKQSGFERTLLYTSTGNQALKNTVMRNFDASLRQSEQDDEYDIIVATDALSEGFNLHRAGVIINYDIPYNPTRVVQRVGRINRIDQRNFDELKIYNLFPTTIGEKVVGVKGIASMKMLLMNQIVGNDTKVLAEDEDIESFFQRQYQQVNTDDDAAWDNAYRNIYDAVKEDRKLIAQVRRMSTVTIARKYNDAELNSIALVRRGKNLVFMGLDKESRISIITPARALEILQAEEEEEALESGCAESLRKFQDELAKPYELPKMFGNRGYALDVIEALAEVRTQDKDYLNKLHNTVRKYDGLCEAELHIIVQLDLDNIERAMQELYEKIPEWYLDAMREKAEQIESAESEIIFVEDLK